MFSSTQKKRAKELRKVSNAHGRIFEVFTSTQEACKKLVEDITDKINSRRVEVANLNDEIATLENHKKMNDSLHNKIEQFLNS